jgi:heme exporter protein A
MADGRTGRDFRLALDAVAARRGGHVALEGVSVEITPGRTFVLRGPNGSGKSTLLRVIAGFLEPCAGRISLAGAERRAMTASLGHADGVKLALTARENLRFWRVLYGAGEQAVEAALRAARVDGFLDQRAATLSAGQRRRLALCRPLLSKRPLLLLDEPTAGMDAASVEAVIGAINKHCEDGGAAVVATHEPIAFNAQKTITLAVGGAV